MGNTNKIREIFRTMQKETEDDREASAVLTLCVVIRDFYDELDHVLCMGIRHGLFGESADSDDSIHDLNLDRYLKDEDEE